jgi:RimJ/RimL family protein N-acetyltransferase
MIKLEPFSKEDFSSFISWIDSEELLITIAGWDLSYPLTASQLQTYLDDQSSHAFNIVDLAGKKTIGHAEIRLMGNGVCKLDKVIIGDKSNRGKGTGLQVVHKLVEYSFGNLGARLVELNVFDWNTAGIKCYTKAGFSINPDKQHSMQVNGKNWMVLNMIFTREEWNEGLKDLPRARL